MSDLSVALRGWHMGIKPDVINDSRSDHEVTSQYWYVLCRVVIIVVAKVKISIGISYVNVEINQQVACPVRLSASVPKPVE